MYVLVRDILGSDGVLDTAVLVVYQVTKNDHSPMVRYIFSVKGKIAHRIHCFIARDGTQTCVLNLHLASLWCDL